MKKKKIKSKFLDYYIEINSRYKNHSDYNDILKVDIVKLIENLKFSIDNNFKFLSEYILDKLLEKCKNEKDVSNLLITIINCNNNEIINYLVEKLLKLNKDIKNIKYNNDFTALHLLVWKNNLDGVKIILKHNLKIDLRNNKNYTALHLASSNGNIEIVRLLLKYGADKYLKVNDLTSLDLAEKTKNIFEFTGDNRKYLYPKIIELLK